MWGLRILSYKKGQSWHNKLIEGYRNKFEKAGWKITHRKTGFILAKDDFEVCGIAENTLWTGYGVFVREDYAFYDDADYIMIDIGFNLGFTSLKMAQRKNIKKIYAFEPFAQTLKQARENMALNPKLARKIKIFDYGLSDADKVKEIHYNPKMPGGMSTVRDSYPECQELTKVVLRHAADVLRPILQNNKHKVFVKIDCEGAETEIIPCLDKAKLLKKVDLIIMEWHFGCFRQLIEVLTKNGFVVCCTHEIAGERGMITAFRKKTAGLKRVLILSLRYW